MSPGPQKQFDTEEALEKAMVVFWRNGFAGSSLSELLSEMGIGKKSLYDTYGNKRDLFLKALDLYSKRSNQAIKEKLNKPGSPLDNLLEFLDGLHQAECKGCFLGTNMADFDLTDKEVAFRICRHLKNFESALEDTLKKAQLAGEIRPELNTGDLASMLSCLCQGTSLVSRVGSCTSRQDQALAAVSQILKQ